MKNKFPQLEINLGHIRNNVACIVERCRNSGMQVAGVLNAVSGMAEIAKAFDEGGITMLASSKLEHLQSAKEVGIEKPLILTRVPSTSEIADVIETADISFNSDFDTILKLDEEACKQNKLHQVVLVINTTSLSEGLYDLQEIESVAEYIENQLVHTKLVGISSTGRHQSGKMISPDNLKRLVEIADVIEAKLGRELEYICTGAFNSLMQAWEGKLPDKINLLNVGEGILLTHDMAKLWEGDINMLRQDIFKLRGEIIEVKNKPTYPVGKLAVDAFGNSPTYVDRGIRRRALLAMGKLDYGFIENLSPLDEGAEVLGASSDHTIVDVEAVTKELKPGDVMDFDVCYSIVTYLTHSKNVNIIYV